jgi:hypothetical protein
MKQPKPYDAPGPSNRTLTMIGIVAVIVTAIMVAVFAAIDIVGIIVWS